MKRAREVIREKLPALHDRLERLRREDPEHHKAAMRRVVRVIVEYLKLHERNPELAETIIEEFEIEGQLHRQSGRYKEAEGNPDQQAVIRDRIEQLVRRQFELRFQRHAAGLEGFEARLRRQIERLEREREKLDRELERRDELVAERVEEVLRGEVRGMKLRRRGPRHGRPGGELDEPPPGDDTQAPRPRRHPNRRRVPPPDDPEGE